MVKHSVLTIALATLLALPVELNAPYMVPQWVLKNAKEMFNEKICKAWVVSDESRGESFLAKRAVLDVVSNRMRKQGKSCNDIVKSPNQFSGYRPGMHLKVSKEDLQSYEKVVMMSPVVPSATHFHANYVHPVWCKKLVKIRSIGKHIFYKETKEK